jgi:hypothetical protein
MTLHERIRELTGCSRDEANSIALAAIALNRQEELRTIDDLRPDEFVALIERAKIVNEALSRRIRAALEPEGA